MSSNTDYKIRLGERKEGGHRKTAHKRRLSFHPTTNIMLINRTKHIQYRFNTTSHSRVLHTQVHSPILARESTRTSRLGKVFLESRELARTASNKHLCIVHILEAYSIYVVS